MRARTEPQQFIAELIGKNGPSDRNVRKQSIATHLHSERLALDVGWPPEAPVSGQTMCPR